MNQQRPESVALNADVVGYSRLIADNLEATTAVMDEYRGLVERRVAENGGILVNFVGDNFMAVFVTAMEAMRAAIAITTDVEDANQGLPPARRAWFRMGLDQGVVTISDGNYFGDPLNVAARIQALAPSGGISVSGRVYLALDEPELRFRPVGRRRLRNIPEETDIYEFADLPRDGSSSTGQRPLSLESPTVAVLPVHVQTDDPSVRATADIMRSDLLHRLARIPQLAAIDARAEPSGERLRETARYFIETGILQAGELVRAYANVLDVSTMNIVKAHKWTLSPSDLLARSEELVEDVARSIEVDLVVGAPAGLYADLDDPQAIEQIYLGWYHLTTATPEGWARALELFGAVARTHPEKPYGSVLSAFTNWMGATNGWAPDKEAALRTALDQARLGLTASDQTGMAKTVEAAVLMSQGHNQEALEAIESVEIVRPTCDATFGVAGSVRRYLGQWEQAVDLTDRAMRLTGVNKPWYPTVKACSLFIGRRTEQAAAMAEMVLEHQPNNLEALLVLAASQVELGLDRRARATVELIRERYPSVDVEGWLDANPYQDRNVLDRWRKDLIVAGAIPGASDGAHA